MTTNKKEMYELLKESNERIRQEKETNEILFKLMVTEDVINVYKDESTGFSKKRLGELLMERVSELNLEQKFEEFMEPYVGAGGECASFEDYDWDASHYVDFLQDYIENIKLKGIKGI